MPSWELGSSSCGRRALPGGDRGCEAAKEGLRAAPIFERPEASCGPHLGGPDRMIQRAEQANIVGLRSKDFVQWVEQNIDARRKRGPCGAVRERLKRGLIGRFTNWPKWNST